MIPVRVSIEGFLSYNNETIFLFDGQPLWILAGPNGAGKSAVFDAISFALYNLHRGGKQNFGHLVNHNCSQAIVEFEFEFNSHNYLVRRTISKNNGSTTYQAKILKQGNWSIEANTDKKEGFERWRDNLIGLTSDAFSASVMLTQGRSDALLNSQPRVRRDILASIINLSRYKLLFEEAKKKLNFFTDERKKFEAQLNTIDSHSISPKSLEQAQNYFNTARDKVLSIISDIKNLEEQIMYSKRWHKLKEKQVSIGEQISHLKELIEHEEEIENDWLSWNDLNRVLPILRQIKRDQSVYDTAIHKISSVLPLISKEYYSPVMYENFQVLLEDKSIRIDVAQDLILAREKIEELLDENIENRQQIGIAIPHIKSLSTAQTKLIQADQDRKTGEEEHQNTNKAWEELNEEYLELIEKHKIARELLATASQDLTKQETLYQQAEKRRNDFDVISGDEVCYFCGQPISEQHIRIEKKRLDKEKADLFELRQTAHTQKNQARAKVDELQEDIDRLQENIEKLEHLRSGIENSVRVAMSAVENFIAQMNMSYDNLPTVLQAQIAPNSPEVKDNWKVIILPDETQIEELQDRADEINIIKNQKQHVSVLFEHTTACLSALANFENILIDLQDNEWVEAAHNLSKESLALYENQKQELEAGNIQERHQELTLNRSNLNGLYGELRGVEEEINEIDASYQIPTGDLSRQLSTLGQQKLSAEAERDVAISTLSNLQRQEQDYRQWTSAKQNAAAQERIYSKLSQLLGDTGIQLSLIRQAEEGIVRLANETLISLSNGDLYIELIDSSTTTDALDIVVIDKSKGGTKIDVSYVSGSQRFRIAISLALAISQFASGKARQIQSVIIDEGFGSLDKAGREATIQELERLSEQSNLKRIILVSHQEEFFQAFRRGYFIKIKNNSSAIEPILS